MNKGEMSYSDWMNAVNRVIINRIGLSQGDLPDWNSRICYDSGAEPKDGAEECLENFADSMGYGSVGEMLGDTD